MSEVTHRKLYAGMGVFIHQWEKRISGWLFIIKVKDGRGKGSSGWDGSYDSGWCSGHRSDMMYLSIFLH